MCNPLANVKEGDVLGLLRAIFGDDTLVGRIVACLSELMAALTKRAPSYYHTRLISIAFTGKTTVAPTAQYQTYCTVLGAIRDLYEQDPFNTRCALPATLANLTCPEPDGNETADNYASRLRAPIMNVYALLLQYILDCVCQALQPPCLPDPGDDRVILACVTVRNDSKKGAYIVRTCASCNRHYAGSFPDLKYWFSLTPLIGYAVQQLCCMPDLLRTQSPLVNELANWLDRLDPDGALRRAVAEGDFAVPHMYAGQIGRLITNLRTAQPLEMLRPTGVNLGTLVDRPADEARKTLEANQVTVVEHRVASAGEAASLRNLSLRPFAAPGETVLAYRLGDKIIGYGPAEAQTVRSVAAPQDDIQTLRDELARLREEVAQLRIQPPAAPGGGNG
jgi:hypothetical protein